MRLETPEIYWHGNKERIMSIDFHPFNGSFVSAGSDSENQKTYIRVSLNTHDSRSDSSS